jgi:hypothetical protein
MRTQLYRNGLARTHGNMKAIISSQVIDMLCTLRARSCSARKRNLWNVLSLQVLQHGNRKVSMKTQQVHKNREKQGRCSGQYPLSLFQKNYWSSKKRSIFCNCLNENIPHICHLYLLLNQFFYLGYIKIYKQDQYIARCNKREVQMLTNTIHIF